MPMDTTAMTNPVSTKTVTHLDRFLSFFIVSWTIHALPRLDERSLDSASVATFLVAWSLWFRDVAGEF